MAVTLKQLVKEKPGGFRIYHRGDYRFAGRLLTLVGLAASFGLLGIGYLNEPLFIIPVIIGFCGLVLAFTGPIIWFLGRHSSFVNTQASRFEKHGMLPIPFESVVAVEVGIYVHTVPTEYGPQPSQRYRVSFVTKHTDPDVVAQFEAVLGQLEAAATRDPEAVAQARAELEEYRAKLCGETVALADHVDLLRVWLVAELLAKTLEVPMLDFCGEAMEERSVAELDMSLYERFQRRGTKPPAPGPVPEGIDTSWSSEDCFVAVWKPSLLSRRKTLGIDGSSASFAGDSLPLTAIETVRAETELHDAVLLIGNAKAIRCPVAASAQAEWLSCAVQHFVCGRDAAKAGDDTHR